MPFQVGDPTCTAPGFAKDMFDFLMGDARSAFPVGQTDAQKDMIRAICWACARATANQIPNLVTSTPGAMAGGAVLPGTVT